MDIHLLSLCLLIGLAVIPYALSVTYKAVYHKMTWAKAQQYCRTYFNDLATVGSDDDLISLHNIYDAWIGLHDDPASWFRVMSSNSNSWRWSTTGTTCPRGYQNWDDSEPNNAYGAESCVALKANGKWVDRMCTDKYRCLCYAVQQGVKIFTALNDEKSWNDCRTLCRQTHHDLAMIEDMTENFAAQSLVDIAWIGLYRHPWNWSDRNTSQIRNWRSGEPNNYNSNQHCAAIDGNKQWVDDPCSLQKFFLCNAGPSLCEAASPDSMPNNSAHFECPRQKLVLVKELLSWEQALDHCKTLGSYSLLSDDLSDMETIKFVLRFATSNKVWLSLRFLAGSWFWADGAPFPLPSLPPCPDSLHCGALLRNGTSIEPTDCSQKHNLLCYQEL